MRVVILRPEDALAPSGPCISMTVISSLLSTVCTRYALLPSDSLHICSSRQRRPDVPGSLTVMMRSLAVAPNGPAATRPHPRPVAASMTQMTFFQLDRSIIRISFALRLALTGQSFRPHLLVVIGRTGHLDLSGIVRK